MDAFEQIVEMIFRHEGYWTWRGYRVDLTKDDKKAIGKSSIPRVEIDILAYKPKHKELIWVECKSFLDSTGVGYSKKHGVHDATDPSVRSFKMFNDDDKKYREVITQALLRELDQKGLISIEDHIAAANFVKYALVAGKLYQPKKKLEGELTIAEYFQERGWLLYDIKWIQPKLKEIAGHKYENDVVTILAKLLSREE